MLVVDLKNPITPAPSSRSLYICSRVPRADECERAWRIERSKFWNSPARPGTSLVLKTRKPTRTRKNMDPIKLYSRSTPLLLPSWPMMWAVPTSWTKVRNDMMCSHRACKYNTGGGEGRRRVALHGKKVPTAPAACIWRWDGGWLRGKDVLKKENVFEEKGLSTAVQRNSGSKIHE